MPTYEYRCEACGHQFEQYQSITAAPLRKCPACRKVALQRLLGAGSGIIFKGSGFYATDYRSDSYRSAAKAEKKAVDSGNGKGESTKPADKPASTKKPAKAGSGTTKKD